MGMNFNIGVHSPVLPPPPACGARDSAASAPASLLSGAGVALASGVPGGVEAEGVGAAVEAALVRDDALGRLMDAAFNLPPPAPPKFEEQGAC